MSVPAVRVLVVEDSPTDVLLLRAALESDHLNTFALTCAERLSDAQACLEQGQFDIALLDLGLPDSQGLGTFARLHSQSPNLPIIVFSGNDDEQAAAQAVRAGAQDYLVKNQAAWDTAARAIRYAIERQRAQQKIRESEELYRNLVDNASEAIYVLQDEKLVFANSVAAQWVELGLDELLGRSIYNFVLPADGERLRKRHHDLLSGMISASQDEFLLQSPTGRQKWLNVNSCRIDWQGRPATLNLATDFTERRQMDEALRASEARFSKVFHASPIGINIFRLADGRSMDTNDTLLEMLGYTRDEIVGHSAAELNLFVDVEARNTWMQKLMAGQEVHNQDARVRCKSGEIKDMLASLEVIDINSEPMILVIVADITERKKMDVALRKSEERYHQFVSQSFEGIYRTEFDQPIDTTLPVETQIDLIYENAYMAECNRALAEMYGLPSVDALLNTRLVDVHGGKDNPVNRAAFRKFIEAGYVSINDETIEYTVEGRPIWFLSNTVGTVENGLLVCLWGTTINITERKLAEEKSQHYTEQLAAIVEIEHSLAISLDYGAIFTALQTGIHRIFPDVPTLLISSFDAEHAMIKAVYGIQDGKSVDVASLPEIPLAPAGQGTQSRVIHSRQALVINEDLKRNFRPGTVTRIGSDGGEETQSALYVPMLAQDQVLGVIQLQSYMPNRFTEEDVKALSLVANAAAITLQNARLYEMAQKEIGERRQAEIALRQSEERHRLISSNISDYVYSGVVFADGTTKTEWVSGAFERITSYTLEEVNALPGGFFSLVVRQDFDELLQKEPNLLQSPTLAIEYRIRRRDGEIRWLRDYMQMAGKTDTEAVVRRIGAVQDITARKLAEEQLRTSEEKYRSLVESSDAAIGLIDTEGRYQYINELGARWYGKKAEDFVGKTLHELFPEFYPDPVPAYLREVFERNEGCVREATSVFDDGRWYRLSIQPVRDGQGRPVQVMVNSVDITQSKRAEEDLKQTYELFSRLFHFSPIPTMLINLPNQIFTDLNAAAEKLTGYSRADLLGHSTAEYNIFARQDEREKGLGMLAEKGQVDAFEFKLRTGTEVEKDCFLYIEVLELKGQPHALIQVVDVTEQKKTAQTLQDVERKYQLLVEQSPVVVYSSDPDNWLYLSPKVEQLLGYPPEDYIKNNTLWESHLHPDDRAMLQNQTQKCLETGEMWQVEYRSFHRDGHIVWVRDEAKILLDPQSGEHIFHGILYDITERKLAEEKLRQSEAQYRYLFENNPHPMWAYDLQTLQFLAVNESAVDKYGYSKEEFLGMTIADIRPADDVQRLLENIAQPRLALQHSGDWRHKLKNGEVIDVEITSHTLELTGRSAALVVAQDITERKKVAEELRQSNERFMQLANNVADIFWVSEPVTRKNLYVSPAFATVVGLSAAEVAQLPHAFLDVLLPEDQPILIRAREQEDSGFKTDIQYRIRRPDGAIRWIRDKGAPVLDENGNVVRIVGIATDITPLRDAEEALRESETNYRLLFELSPNGIVIHDGRQILFTNPAAAQLVGARNNDELVGMNLLDFVHPDSRSLVMERLKSQARGVVSAPAEEKFVRLDGSSITVEVSAAPIQQKGQATFLVTIHDISERKQAEREAIYRQKLLEKVIQLGKNITAIIDLDLCLREIHRSIQHGLGFDRVGIFLYDAAQNFVRGTYGTSRNGELVKNDWYQRPVEEWTDWQVALQDPSGMWVDNDFQAAHNPSPDEEMYGVKEHVTLAAWAGDKPVALLVVDNLLSHKDMSPADLESLQLFAGYTGLAIENAQLHASLEQRIKERTAEVQDLYENAPTGYHSLDAQGNYLMINKTELDWLGYARDEVIGRPVWDFFTAPSVVQFQENFPVFKQRGWIRDLDFEIVCKDGSILPILVNATAIYNDSGDYVMSRSTVFNNIERKKAEKALRESEETYRALFEKANDAIFLFDANSRIYVRANSRCAELLGLDSAEELIGQNSTNYVAPAQVDDADTRIQRLLAGERLQPYERTLLRKDGTLVETEINISLIRDSQGNPKVIQSVVRDITQRKQAQEALRLANREMERAMRVKDEFLASMSHELRTPLTGILGLSEALQMQTYGDLSEKQLKALKNIETSGRHLLELINDILDLSKIEAGKFEMQFDLCSLGDICQASLQLTKGLAQKKRQEVGFSMKPAALIVRADARRLKQMLVNLLSNAVKFTPDGGSLGLEVLANPVEQVVKLSVWDKGIGIAPEDIQMLFKPFVQLDSSLARRHSGTGLGLSLVQRMAELHGGSIQVESTPNVGSRFTIILPWSPQVDRPAPSRSTRNITPVHQSLTVEDSEVDAEQITRYLQHLGIQNKIHPLGTGAVELATRLNPGIILLDLQLPDKSGFDVLSELKSDIRTQHIPVVICSGEESRQKAQSLGADGYLVKPFTLTEMRTELSHVTSEQKLPDSAMTIATKRIMPLVMVVDDNQVTLETIADFLSSRQFQVVVARSGMELLELAPNAHPDIILMDIQMPGMDGLETTRRIRANADPQLAKVPIIALTALAMPGDREMCLAAGANEYLSKPVNLQKLVEMIQSVSGKT